MTTPGAVAPRRASGVGRWQGSVHATRLAGLGVGAVVVLYVLARFTGDSWLIFGAAAAAACLVVDFLAVAAGTGMRVAYHRPSRCAVGDEAQMAITVHNARRWMLSAAEVYEEHPGFDRASGLVVDVPAGRSGRVVLSPRATARGVYHQAGTFGATITGPLGFFQQRISGAVRGPIFVHPHRAVPLSLAAVASVTGYRTSGLRGWGLEPHGLRPWRPGDAAHGIHWRSTARVGEPVVLERESEISTGLVVLVGPAIPTLAWEERIATAAATAIAALQRGITPVLLSDAARVEGATKVTPTVILDWFAALPTTPVMPASSNALAAAAAEAAGPGGTVLWLSADTPPAAVAAVIGRAGATLVQVPGGGGRAA